MRALQAFLAIGSLALLVYTSLVILDHGPNLWPTYLAGIAAMGWYGQFTLDFSVYLLLSGVWVSWRHRFSGAGIALGVLSGLGGLCFFGPYLLWASTKGDGVEALLLGERRSSTRSGSPDECAK